MSISDSRTGCSDYWRTRPYGLRLFVLASLAGLLAMYIPLCVLAVFGIWRNNLLRLDMNWPWAFPLAGLSILGQKFNRVILFHAMIFVPLLAFQGVMLTFVGLKYISQFWMAPVALISIAVLNVVLFLRFSRGVSST